MHTHTPTYSRNFESVCVCVHSLPPFHSYSHARTHTPFLPPFLSFTHTHSHTHTHTHRCQVILNSVVPGSEKVTTNLYPLTFISYLTPLFPPELEENYDNTCSYIRLSSQWRMSKYGSQGNVSRDSYTYMCIYRHTCIYMYREL